MSKKVFELEGKELAYWVAKSIDAFPYVVSFDEWVEIQNLPSVPNYHPDIDWSQCGELIEAYKIRLDYCVDCESKWMAIIFTRKYGVLNPAGKTPQEAICRAVVLSVYGDEVGDDE